jgi:hypothetical protein
MREPFAGRDDTGVIAVNVDATITAERGVGHDNHVVGRGNIDFDEGRIATGISNCRGREGSCRPVALGNHDASAFQRKLFGDAPADAGAGAGYDRHFIFQSQIDLPVGGFSW